MSEQTPQNTPENIAPENIPKPVKLRIWPAVAVGVFQVAGGWLAVRLASTNVESGMAIGLVPLASSLLLLLWWITASRAPWRDQIAGAALYLLAVAAVVFSQATPAMGGLLLALALPALTVTLAAAFAVTVPVPWKQRRLLLALCVIVCAGVYCAKRVDEIGGDLLPVVSWRWTPDTEARSAAVSGLSVNGTAELPAEVAPEDWPLFRGRNQDGRAPGVVFSTDWAGKPPREVWRRPVGSAWSSFTVVGNYLFTQEQRGGAELVTCYRADTGEPVWANSVEARFEDAMGLGPRSTPTYDRGRLYTQGCTGILQCIDAATGETLWRRDVPGDTGGKVPSFGISCSPLVVGDLVVQFSSAGDGKSAIAYRRDTGEPAWTAGKDTDLYSSPHYSVIGGVPQILMTCDYGIQSFTPETGALLWDQEWKVKQYSRCVQPYVEGDSVLVGATGTGGAKRYRAAQRDGKWELTEEWFSREYRPYFNDGVGHKGHFYGYDGDRLVCIDLATGKRLWKGERHGGQVLLLPDMDMLLVLTEKGRLVLVPAVPDAYSETASMDALNGKTWNHPVIVRNKLYVRNSETAACYELPI